MSKKSKPKAIAEGVTKAARDYLQNKSMKTLSRLRTLIYKNRVS